MSYVMCVTVPFKFIGHLGSSPCMGVHQSHRWVQLGVCLCTVHRWAYPANSFNFDVKLLKVLIRVRHYEQNNNRCGCILCNHMTVVIGITLYSVTVPRDQYDCSSHITWHMAHNPNYVTLTEKSRSPHARKTVIKATNHSFNKEPTQLDWKRLNEHKLLTALDRFFGISIIL